MEIQPYRERWAEDRYDWTAVALLMPLLVAVVILAALMGARSVGLFIVMMAVGYAGTLARKPVAAWLRARHPAP